MTRTIKTYLLDVTVFISGAVVMILELTGSRILAPYIGTSLPVWTSIIGVVLGSLSLGYFLGGKLADRSPSLKTLSIIIFVSSILICIVPILNALFTPLVIKNVADIRSTAVLTSAILFVLPSIVLGMISPYAIRLKLSAITTSGQTAGQLYALSTIGSIVGTFLTGFYLLATFGSFTIIYIISGVMLLLSLVVGVISSSATLRMIVGIGFFALLMWNSLLFSKPTNAKVISVDTPYNSVRIYDYGENGNTVREMLVGNVRMSAMYLNSDELAFEYTKYYRLADHFNPSLKNTLMIGGAGYSYPKEFVQTHPQGHIDVVEIDPALTDIAKQYFSLKPTNNMTIYHEDARTFLNKNTKKYDAIYNDAFGSSSVPFQLTTKEAITEMADSLTENGVVISNTISSLRGDKGKFLRAEYRTYREVFPHVYVFPVQTMENTSRAQNIMLVASKKALIFETPNKDFQQYFSHLWREPLPEDVPILTDFYAPVEHYELFLFDT